MRKRLSSRGLTVNAIAGTHVVMLGLDLSDARRDGCLGFAIQREDHTEDERYWMRGMKTFEETDPGLGPGETVPSIEHPFQGFQWADYTAKPQHEYTYTVVPLAGSPGALTRRRAVSVEVETEPELGAPHSVFFNRGAVAAQEYARRFQDKEPSQFADPAERDAAYRWLSRGLFEAFKAFVARADGGDYELHAALYEFNWPEALAAFRSAADSGAKVEVLFHNVKPDESTERKNRAAIAAAKIKGLCTPRTTGNLMHNKFVVLSRKGTPVAVWTGSTNLSENGIFGHLNCGHIVESEPVARAYLEYWQEMRTNPDPNSERAWMAEHNPSPPDPWDEDLTLVFSPHKGNGVLDWYKTIAAGAKEALFMTFAFGMDERFKEVYGTDDDVLRIALMEQEGIGRFLKRDRDVIRKLRARPNVLVAVGNRIMTTSFDRWLAERGGLTSNVEWVHTKFMLVDPLSRAPVVETGSANFSKASTSSNNENMLVIRGDTRVADIYLGELMRVWSHYAFREAVARAKERGETRWRPQHLVPSPAWQTDYYSANHDRSLRRRYFAQTL